MFASIFTAQPKAKPLTDPSTVEALPSLCQGCYWQNKGGVTCEAFPTGIPLPILLGNFDHHLHYEDENVSDDGITFRPIAT